MNQRSRLRNRAYQIKKNGIKDDYIDKQILAIHYAIVTKMLENPHLVAQVVNTLNERRDTGKIGYGAYITWVSLLELIDEPATFSAGILDYSAKMRRFRRKTPFVNILTEEERVAALNVNSIGEFNSINLF